MGQSLHTRLDFTWLDDVQIRKDLSKYELIKDITKGKHQNVLAVVTGSNLA